MRHFSVSLKLRNLGSAHAHLTVPGKMTFCGSCRSLWFWLKCQKRTKMVNLLKNHSLTFFAVGFLLWVKPMSSAWCWNVVISWPWANQWFCCVWKPKMPITTQEEMREQQWPKAEEQTSTSNKDVTAPFKEWRLKKQWDEWWVVNAQEENGRCDKPNRQSQTDKRWPLLQWADTKWNSPIQGVETEEKRVRDPTVNRDIGTGS